MTGFKVFQIKIQWIDYGAWIFFEWKKLISDEELSPEKNQA